jgi:hypothetical protein
MQQYDIFSFLPYRNSNRGIDVLIRLLLKNNKEVRVIKYPNYLWTRGRNNKSDEIFPVSPLIGYKERICFRVSRPLFKILSGMATITIPKISFDKTEVVVLESGYPIFFLNKIPKTKKIIYRQSDPIELIGSKNRYFAEMERRTIERADLTLVVNAKIYEYYKKTYPLLTKKMVVWKNGINISKTNKTNNPYKNGSFNIVYMGLAPIREDVINAIGHKYPNIKIHIIGYKPRGIESPNIITYGYMSPEKYIPYIEHADLALVPYDEQWPALKWGGVTSKIYLFMYHGLPVLTTPKIKWNAPDGIVYCETIDEYIEKVGAAIARKEKLAYSVDWEAICGEKREEELKETFTKYNLL